MFLPITPWDFPSARVSSVGCFVTACCGLLPGKYARPTPSPDNVRRNPPLRSETVFRATVSFPSSFLECPTTRRADEILALARTSPRDLMETFQQIILQLHQAACFRKSVLSRGCGDGRSS
jgi:hypothetical protein